jgi:hypothetical protein
VRSTTAAFKVRASSDRLQPRNGTSSSWRARQRRQETWEDSPEGYPQSPPYKWWNWHDNYAAEASPDAKWVEVSDAGEAAFRNRDAGAKA